jgi:RHS repeat-associated protein
VRVTRSVRPTTQTTTNTYNGNAATSGDSQPTTLTSTSTSTSGSSTTTPSSYGYNADGEQTSRSTATGSQSLSWDNQGQLTGVTNSTTSTNSSYVYDADGNLLIETDGSDTTLYLPSEQITVNTSSGSTVSADRYYDLPGGATAVRTGTGSNYDFEIASDQHGTNTLYLNSTCQTPTWRQYDPYGNARGTAQTWIDNHGFLDKVDDATTALTFIGARWYDPVTGSFISLDPVLEASDPTQLGGYEYSGNDPVSSSDPTGDMRDCMYGGCGTGGGGDTGSSGGGNSSSGGTMTTGSSGTATVTDGNGDSTTYHALKYIVVNGRDCATSTCAAYAEAKFYAYSELANQVVGIDQSLTNSLMNEAVAPIDIEGLTSSMMQKMGIDIRGASLASKAENLAKKLLDPFSGLFDAGPSVSATDPPLSSREGPDYVVFDAAVASPFFVGGGALATVTRDGHLYLGVQGVAGTPGEGSAVRAGTIMGDRSTQPESSIDSFVGGLSVGISGTAGVSGAVTLGQPQAYRAQSSYSYEVGAGVPGGGISVSWSWRMGFNLPTTW